MDTSQNLVLNRTGTVNQTVSRFIFYNSVPFFINATTFVHRFVGRDKITKNIGFSHHSKSLNLSGNLILLKMSFSNILLNFALAG